MGGEQPGQAGAVAEQHVADFLGVAAVAQQRAVRQPGDLLQRAGQAGGLARELHRRGIGQRTRAVRLMPALISRPKNRPM
jgi:hypothetical protein